MHHLNIHFDLIVICWLNTFLLNLGPGRVINVLIKSADLTGTYHNPASHNNIANVMKKNKGTKE